METFIYKELREVCLNKNYEKILTLGPFAAALSQIIYRSFENRNDKIKEKYMYKSIYSGMLVD